MIEVRENASFALIWLSRVFVDAYADLEPIMYSD
jgi:hypothetical protein